MSSESEVAIHLPREYGISESDFVAKHGLYQESNDSHGFFRLPRRMWFRSGGLGGKKQVLLAGAWCTNKALYTLWTLEGYLAKERRWQNALVCHHLSSGEKSIHVWDRYTLDDPWMDVSSTNEAFFPTPGYVKSQLQWIGRVLF